MSEATGPLKILSYSAVADRLGVSVRTLQRLVERREFVGPVRMGPNRVGFYAHEVEGHLATLPRA